MPLLLLVFATSVSVYGPPSVTPVSDGADQSAPCPPAASGEIVVCKKPQIGDAPRYRQLTDAYDAPEGMPLLTVKLPGGFCLSGLSIGTCW